MPDIEMIRQGAKTLILGDRITLRSTFDKLITFLARERVPIDTLCRREDGGILIPSAFDRVFASEVASQDRKVQILDRSSPVTGAALPSPLDSQDGIALPDTARKMADRLFGFSRGLLRTNTYDDARFACLALASRSGRILHIAPRFTPTKLAARLERWFATIRPVVVTRRQSVPAMGRLVIVTPPDVSSVDLNDFQAVIVSDEETLLSRTFFDRAVFGDLANMPLWGRLNDGDLTTDEKLRLRGIFADIHRLTPFARVTVDSLAALVDDPASSAPGAAWMNPSRHQLIVRLVRDRDLSSSLGPDCWLASALHFERFKRIVVIAESEAAVCDLREPLKLAGGRGVAVVAPQVAQQANLSDAAVLMACDWSMQSLFNLKFPQNLWPGPELILALADRNQREQLADKKFSFIW